MCVGVCMYVCVCVCVCMYVCVYIYIYIYIYIKPIDYTYDLITSGTVRVATTQAIT